MVEAYWFGCMNLVINLDVSAPLRATCDQLDSLDIAQACPDDLFEDLHSSPRRPKPKEQ